MGHIEFLLEVSISLFLVVRYFSWQFCFCFKYIDSYYNISNFFHFRLLVCKRLCCVIGNVLEASSDRIYNIWIKHLHWTWQTCSKLSFFCWETQFAMEILYGFIAYRKFRKKFSNVYSSIILLLLRYTSTCEKQFVVDSLKNEKSKRARDRPEHAYLIFYKSFCGLLLTLE